MPTWNDHPVAVVRKPRNKKIYMRYQDGALVVMAPSFITDEQIRQFLFDNKEWIERQEKKQANTALREGGFLYLFGERYGLKKGESTRIENGTLFYTDETAWKLFIRHYATPRLRARFEQVRLRYGFQAVDLRFGFYRSKWGSCTPARRCISLNVNLAFVPLECVEAIILHELCHLEHPDHSKAFYAAIHRRMPDYDERMARLKDIEIPHF